MNKMLDKLLQVALHELLNLGYEIEKIRKNLFLVYKNGLKSYVHIQCKNIRKESLMSVVHFEKIDQLKDESGDSELLYIFVSWVEKYSEVHFCIFNIDDIGGMGEKVMRGYNLKIAELESNVSKLKYRDKFAEYNKISNVKEHSEVQEIINQIQKKSLSQFDVEPSDIKVPERADITTSRIIRDNKLSREIKELNDYTCQLCGTSLDMPDNKKYAEAHHIQPLGEPHNGPDVAENMICVCPNCHALLDYRAITLPAKIEGAHEIGQVYINYHNDKIYKKI